jgi:chromosome partitioning protein
MAAVITVAQQKGGAGKTMLAANLAASLAGTMRVALLDIDPQKSLTRWHKLRAKRVNLPQILLSDVSGWRLAAELDRLAREADMLIVDTPPQIDSDATRAIRAASLIILPLQPSPPDLWAAEGTLTLAAAERKKVALVLNRAPARSTLRTQVENEIHGRKLNLLASVIGNRAGYANAFALGMGVIETAPKGLAAQEFAELVNEIKDLMG